MLFFNSVVDVIVARAAADHTNASAPSWRSPAMLEAAFWAFASSGSGGSRECV
jgi:hypothetical protein